MEYTVTGAPVVVEAETPEEAAALARDIFARRNVDEFKALPKAVLYKALEFYANPESYWAIFIVPDPPAGMFADDVGCVLLDDEHDHRHGRTARKALGNEWWGTEPCEAMAKTIDAE